jgi:hypothetical protein
VIQQVMQCDGCKGLMWAGCATLFFGDPRELSVEAKRRGWANRGLDGVLCPTCVAKHAPAPPKPKRKKGRAVGKTGTN